jgi:hypothetical protein
MNECGCRLPGSRPVLGSMALTNGTSSVLTRLPLGKRHQTLTTSDDDPYVHSTCSCTSPCLPSRGSTLTVQGYGTVVVVRVDKTMDKSVLLHGHTHISVS